ncbi:MAG: EamA family transporter [Rhodobacterales bacterium]|nr:MAG: EamA family transporter [Rhodobacterales bacterium]
MTGATKITWALLALLGFLWGASFTGTTVAIEGYGPFTVVALRVAMAAVVLTALARIGGHRLPARGTRQWRRVWAVAIGMGLFGNVLPFLLLSWAQAHVASGFAGVSMAAVPLITLLLAFVILKTETLTVIKIVGLLLGAAGVVVLIGPEALASKGGNLENLARLACLGAALCYALATVLARLVPNGVDQIAFAATITIAATLLIAPLAIAVEGLPTLAPARPTIALILLGLFGTALAQIVMLAIVREAGPTFLALVNYMVPIWSVVLGALLLAEALPPSLIWALGIILVGVALSEASTLKAIFRRD